MIEHGIHNFLEVQNSRVGNIDGTIKISLIRREEFPGTFGPVLGKYTIEMAAGEDPTFRYCEH